MPRRTDVQMLIDALKHLPGEQASPLKLASLLGWDLAKVGAVATRGANTQSAALFIAKGGVIKHRGSERGSSVGIYADVARVITTYWGPRTLGLRNIDFVDTSRSGTRGGGVWTHPDLVVAADPARRKSQNEPRRLHAIEVETAAGFDLRSVYQAHAQGRDADYSWVFGDLTPGIEKPDWDRVLWTAQELGVGLVTFAKPHAFGTWKTWHTASHKSPTAAEREMFAARTLGAPARKALGV